MDTHKLFKSINFFLFVLTVFVVIGCFVAFKEYGVIGQGQNGPATITVNGEGSVTAVPDIADISFTVSKDGTTAKAAQDAVSIIITPALAAVKAEGVADADVQTSSYQLNPKYDNGAVPQVVCFSYPCPPQPTPKIVGYTVSETVEVKVRNVDSTSDLLAKLATAGVSDISGPDFVIDNPTALQDQARAKAITDAQTRAQTLAKELGVHVGKVMSFSDSGSPTFYPQAMNMAVSAGSAAVAPVPQVPTGQNKITSNVSVTYAIN
jgi:uncharacterized protein YggE